MSPTLSVVPRNVSSPSMFSVHVQRPGLDERLAFPENDLHGVRVRINDPALPNTMLVVSFELAPRVRVPRALGQHLHHKVRRTAHVALRHDPKALGADEPDVRLKHRITVPYHVETCWIDLPEPFRLQSCQKGHKLLHDSPHGQGDRSLGPWVPLGRWLGTAGALRSTPRTGSIRAATPSGVPRRRTASGEKANPLLEGQVLGSQSGPQV